MKPALAPKIVAADVVSKSPLFLKRQLTMANG